jgi:chromosome segregation ATPase
MMIDDDTSITQLHRRIAALTARVEELEAMLRTASDMNEVYEGRLQELEGALRDIARQELAGEIPVDEIGDELDWLAGYEGCVHRARAALKEDRT